MPVPRAWSFSVGFLASSHDILKQLISERALDMTFPFSISHQSSRSSSPVCIYSTPLSNDQAPADSSLSEGLAQGLYTLTIFEWGLKPYSLRYKVMEPINRLLSLIAEAKNDQEKHRKWELSVCHTERIESIRWQMKHQRGLGSFWRGGCRWWLENANTKKRQQRKRNTLLNL